mgnify:CR=1 FL=1|tara:strand:+ start:470 stop:823 length:354 start_codon:yes stop_codon:yes gene_type:complete
MGSYVSPWNTAAIRHWVGETVYAIRDPDGYYYKPTGKNKWIQDISRAAFWRHQTTARDNLINKSYTNPDFNTGDLEVVTLHIQFVEKDTERPKKIFDTNHKYGFEPLEEYKFGPDEK